MSVEIDWHALDAQLTASVVSFLNSAFASAARPNFIGDLSVTSFSFGDTQPSVEILDIRDVQKEFLDVDDEDELNLPVPLPAHAVHSASQDDNRSSSSPSDHYRAHHDDTRSITGAGSLYGSYGPLPTPMYHLKPSSTLFQPGLNRSILSHSPTPPPLYEEDLHPPRRARQRSRTFSAESNEELTPPSQLSSSSPSLQLHLRITYSGNLSIGLETSLLINYPSPKFMALPLKLTITSLAFDGVMLVAFEGDRRRIHISLVDPTHGHGGLGVASPGARLLSGAVVESEVGQTDKHVLKNVGKVEKFVLDVARSSLESELVFPNFQTILF